MRYTFRRSDVSRYNEADGRYEVFSTQRGWVVCDRGLASVFERVEEMAFRILRKRVGDRVASERAFELAKRNRDRMRARMQKVDNA